MSYEQLIESIVKEFGNTTYNVKMYLATQIGNDIMECDMTSTTFIMYGKEFEITRDVEIAGDEVIEKWSYEKII